ncbi:hypothetical protein [Vaginisenegalia massiliensis]|uniref:hypothetical protein n=1 Tax=Vaginisenegalia massiliensis TaxID=2058294 RepID=UPI000F54ADEF|nr:hypothetical protein [Vaginisenegalia massiliensis]
MMKSKRLQSVLSLATVWVLGFGTLAAVPTIQARETESTGLKDISTSTEKVTPDDISLENVEWTFGDKISPEDQEKFIEAMKKHGAEGVAMAANFNNGFIEESDLNWNETIFKDIKMTNKEAIDMFDGTIKTVRDLGFNPDYENASFFIREFKGIGDVVCTTIPWSHPDKDEKYVQTVNISMDSELVGIFMEKDKGENQ